MLNSNDAVAARPRGRRRLAAAGLALGLSLGLTAALPARAEDTIKVGVLHSLSGTMAISETTLKDVMLMLIEQQNKKGGVLGKKLEAVVVDPASNWPLFAEKARELISKDNVAAVFGCWTSVPRKSVLPVFKELNSILFYPVQYEGEESERNVFYTGAAPNQQAIPAVDYLMSKEGGAVKRWVLEGTDYVYPRTTNKILEAYLKQKGVADADIMINYTPFGFSDWQTEVAAIKKFGSAGKKTAVVSTVNGDANVPFYKELGNQGIKATDIPVLAFSVGEEELAGLDTKPLLGHLAAWNYFESIKTPANAGFIKEWHDFIKNPKRTTNDPMEAHYIGFAMWVKAVEKAGTTDPDKVIDALPGTQALNLTGGVATLLPNYHITKPVFIGEVRGDGQFDVVWKTKALVPGDAWSDYLPGSKDLEAVLEIVRLAAVRNRFAGTLSHGQKQWLEIGMLLAQDPKLLLVDEPVAGMTDAEARQTADLLKAINREHTVVVVEHDMAFVRDLGVKVTCLHEGAVLAEGTIDQVSANPRVVEVYLGR